MTEERKGKIAVIAGPSGVGKNSIITGVIARCPACSEVVTATTRDPRPHEAQGVDYHFMPRAEFERHVADGTIPEHRIHPTTGGRYGTYLPDLLSRLERGDIAIGDFNIEGVRFLKDRFGALSIFVLPPAFEALEARIRARNAGMPEDELQKRLAVARQEIEHDAPLYDYRIVNEDGKLDETVDKVIEILKKEGYLQE